jgi:hypothetical protein
MGRKMGGLALIRSAKAGQVSSAMNTVSVIDTLENS